MEDFHREKNAVLKDINEISKKTLDGLVEKWISIFNKELVKSNINLLSDHVRTFFNEILTETDKKEETILKKIDSLQKERFNLQRLLHVNKDIEVPNIPLLDYQIELDKNLVDLREELQNRKSQIENLLLQQEPLCDALAEPRLKLYQDPLATAEDIDIFKKNLSYLQKLKIERQRSVAELRSEIKKISKELDIPILDEPGASLLNDVNLTLSQYNIDRLEQLKVDLHQQKEELVAAIKNLKKKLEVLWECLNVDNSIKGKFNAFNGYSQITYDKLKKELDRCETEKRQHIKVFVDRTREEILKMWNVILKSDEERDEFNAFKSECYNEDLLTLHELELQSLKDFYENNRNILESYAEHQRLFNRMIALETTENAPDRLKNRGGQLLKEEQERKKIARELPKIRKQTIDLATEFEHMKRKPFLVHGKNIIDVVNGVYDVREEKKQLIASARKLNGSTIQRTPMSVNKTGLPHSSMKRMASVTALSTNPAKKIHLEVPPVSKVKRGLFVSDENYKSPAFVKPTPVTKAKKKRTAKPVVATLISRRKSIVGRKSKNSSKSSSINKKKSVSSESSVVDYQDFQNCVSARKNSRSSEIQHYKSPLKVNENRAVKLLRPPTPSQPTRTPSPRSACIKLSTKNIPIIF